MGIRMIGIDHSRAVLDVRTIFSFTKKCTAQALEDMIKIDGILGCVLISTCNRMELWVSCQDDFKGCLFEILCGIREVDPLLYREFFVQRKEDEAIQHLFEVSCGLKSKILGEDQIITQVKDALSQARECYAADNVLETLFRMAVTAAKKVKSNISMSTASRSVIHQAVSVLKNEGYEITGKKCMVIGNGEMGKLAATVMREEGADVTVTVRQYRSGMVEIPKDCKRIDYGERMTLFKECDYVVSATASPNYTLKEHCVREALAEHEIVLIDLAVPRDIDPEAAKLSNIKLYDIDYFHIDLQNEQLQKNILSAKQILKEQIHEFYEWYECRDIIPRIQLIKENAAVDLTLRIQRLMKELPIDKEQQNELQKNIEQAAGKVINKMMFGLQDEVSKETFRECVAGLNKVYEK